VDGLQVLDGGCPSQIEDVVADAQVAGASALALGDVSESMLYTDAAAEDVAAGGARRQLPQPFLQRLVLGE
jgi:hypothetical protein